MHKKKSVKKNQLPPYLILLSTVCAVLVIALLISVLSASYREPTVNFIPPEFEAPAVSGIPEVPDGVGYDRIYKDGMTYCVYLSGEVVLENGEAVVWFTNPAENTQWLKLRIYGEGDALIGETGLLKPGEYLRSVPVTGELTSGTPIKIRIMGYEPDTYLSAGAITVNTTITP